jgi:hypothetical protein
MKMNYVTMTEQSAAPATPASGKVTAYFDNTGTPVLRWKDDTGIDRMVGAVRNYSTAQQAPAAAAREYIVGSSLRIPKIKLQAGTQLRWRFNMAKTAAGTATSTFDVCFGTAGTTADTARISFTKPAGTAAADEGFVEIVVTIRSIGATGVAVGTFQMTHNLSATGHAQIPTVVVTTVSSGFDMTVADLIAGVCITTGASDVITIEHVQAEILH